MMPSNQQPLMMDSRSASKERTVHTFDFFPPVHYDAKVDDENGYMLSSSKSDYKLKDPSYRSRAMFPLATSIDNIYSSIKKDQASR